MDKTKKVFLGIGVLAAIAVITFAFAIAASGSDGGVIEQNAEGVTVAASEVTSSISYQGRLTDSAGEPLSGTYDMTFRLYNDSIGGTALDTDTHSVEVTEGLFNTDIDFDQEYFDGRELWFGIAVGGEEMSPRQEFKPVPYALSLVPGAVINGSVSGAPVLHVGNFGNGGAGVFAETYGDGNVGVMGATYGADSNGVSALTSGDSSVGVYALTVGDKSRGVFVTTLGDKSTGVYANTSGDESMGVHASTSGDESTGVSVGTSGDDSPGVFAYTSGDDSPGVLVRSDKHYGIAALTYRSDHKYGVYTPDKMCAMSYDTDSSDIAEYFPVTEDPEPCTVMVIDPTGGCRLRASTKAYDTTVAGIVSTAPGVSLGTNENGNVGETLIAVAGRVPCKVDASYAQIKPGDLLTTSDTPGHAMKATDPVIGTILGKALEPLDSGTGVIEVLVTLQ
jgi:hypothetical protein